MVAIVIVVVMVIVLVVVIVMVMVFVKQHVLYAILSKWLSDISYS